MRSFIFLVTILVFILTSFQGYSQITDSPQQDTTTVSVATGPVEENDLDDDFAPGLLFMALIGLGLVSACIGIGSILAIAALLLLIGFISLGILSSSVFVGLHRRSFSAGFKTFIVSTSSAAGIILGISILYLTRYVFDLNLSNTTTLWIGSSSGLIGGFLLGLITFMLLQYVLRLLKQRLNLQ